MRNIIFGAIGVLWGSLLLLYSIFGPANQGGAYGAGQTAGTVFGVLMLGAGLYYLVQGIQTISQADKSGRSKKRKRRRMHDEDD